MILPMRIPRSGCATRSSAFAAELRSFVSAGLGQRALFLLLMQLAKLLLLLFFFANLCFVQYIAALFISLFLLCIKWEVRLWVKLTW